MNDLTDLKPYSLSSSENESLRNQLLSRQDAFSFDEEPELGALVASLGIAREVRTMSNELSECLFDSEKQSPIQIERTRSELVRFKKAVGVRIWVEDTSFIESRLRGLKELINPRFSYDSQGRLRQLVLFPESIAKILSLQGAQAVIVPQWGLNTIFGGFKPDTHYYQTNLWELDNNDALRFAKLLASKQIPFLGTHDLRSHISGVKKVDVNRLAILGSNVAKTIQKYFSNQDGQSQDRAALVIPYLIGIFLDDLAQPIHYGSIKREAMVEALVLALQTKMLNPGERRRMIVFPESFNLLITFTRESTDEEVIKLASAKVRKLVDELNSGSILSDS